MRKNTRDSHINLIKSPTMPIPWDSTSLGATFECGKYLCVLQKRPRCLCDDEAYIKRLPPPLVPETKFIKEMKFKHLYAMFFYWKRGEDPSGEDSILPALVFTIEVTLLTYEPLLCCFTPYGRWNGGPLNGPLTEENVISEFFKNRMDGHPVRAQKLGDITVGYELIMGKKWNSPQN